MRVPNGGDGDPDLPDGWASVALDDLGYWVGGGTPSKDNQAFWTSGTIPWVSPKDMKASRIVDTQDHVTEPAVGASAASIVPAGAVLIVTRSGILRHSLPVAVLAVDAALNQDLKALVLSDGLDPEYVAAALRAFAGEILERCTKHGTTVHSIEFPRLKSFRIPVAPANEQRRIVAKVDELLSDLDAGVENLKRARALLEKYRKAVLKAAVTGELTREWRKKRSAPAESGAQLLQRILNARREEGGGFATMRARSRSTSRNQREKIYKEPMPPDVFNMESLPETWAIASIDQMTRHLTSGSRSWSKYYGSGTGTFIMAQNVRPGRLDLSVKQPVDPPVNDSERIRTTIQKDDVLVTIVGANTGNTCHVDRELLEHYVCQSVAMMRPVFSVTSRYLELYLCADEGGQKEFNRHIYGMGRPHLSFDQLRRTSVPLPPSDEQEVIVSEVQRYLSVVDALEAQLDDTLRRNKALRESILNAAFSGCLVPQDPHDEPASVVLERIRTERAKHQVNSPRRVRARRPPKVSARQRELTP